MTKTIVIAATCILTLGGCAGTLSQIIDRPITSDHLDEPGEYNKLKTLSGDRRLVRVAVDWSKPHPIGGATYFEYDICSETQADAIAARGANSTLTVAEEGSLADAATQTLTLTNTRSVISDVVRQMSWQLCNARMNGDLNEQQYRDALLALSYNSMVVLQQTAVENGEGIIPLRGAEGAVSFPPPQAAAAAQGAGQGTGQGRAAAQAGN